MKWFSRSEAPPQGGASVSPASVKYQSRAFKAVLADVDRKVAEGGRPLLLDLGIALGSNVDFFAERGYRLQIADLYRSLPPESPVLEPEALVEPLAAALPASDDGGASLVLAWDLFNYFPLRALSAVGERLATCLGPDGIVFALLATLKTMPPGPQRYRVIDAETVETLETDPASAVDAPRYRQPDLERALSGFRVETTYLLRAGVQEYIFRRR